jgi:hypothetical protein
LTIPVDSLSGSIAVPIIDDALSEATESFTVDLSNSVNATLADSQGVGAITDNDVLPSLSIDDVSADEGAGIMTFTVSLSAVSDQDVSIDFTTTDGTAIAPGDYTATSGTVTIPADSGSKTITVILIDDALSEVTESFTVDLSNPVNATIADNQGQGTITDDDPTPSLSVDDVTANEGAGTMTFTVSLSAVSGQAVSVDYTTTDGTAVARDDYTATSGTLTIPAGSGSGTIAVTIIDDAVIEGAETFTVDLSNPVNATIGDNQGTGTIIDDDDTGPVTVSFQDGVNGYTGMRGTKMKSGTPSTNYGSNTKLEIDGSPDESSLLYWDLASIPPGSAIQSVDMTVNVTNGSSHSYELYESLRPWVEGEATWNEYALGQSWQVAGADGSGDRGSTVLGTITGPVGVTTVSLNSDGVAVVQSWVDNPSFNNGFVCLDYVGASDGLDFPSRETGTVSNRPMLTVTYDAEPVLWIDDVSVTEGDAGTVSAVFTPTLSASSSQTVTVDYATTDGTATAGSDYVTVSGQVSFAPGATSQPVTVVVNGDVLDEADQTFFVNLSNAVNATISDNQGVGTIVDDDPTPSLSIDDVSGDEAAGTMTFTVSLSAVSGQAVSTDYTTIDGTAIAPDFRLRHDCRDHNR